MECLIVPVIGSIVILAIAVTQLSVGVQAEVGTNQVLTLGNSKDLVTQTTVVLIVNVLVCKCISLLSGLAVVDLRIVHLLEVSLIVLTRVVNHVILRNKTAVRTPFGIELNLGILVTTLLSGNQHNTVGTTGTVNGTCRSILQHRHRLNIVRVDRVQGAIIWHTIEHNQRVVTC